ncbi:sugar transporter [Labilithrix luteola]|uniref:Sugar transporter n=1 Tax=Labilithrix luteola TaxID=1391654 RepID=A0A0K1PLB6_9BACT|nr:MFS transporter [Labilithrix luteola]AKU94196.1 sugar transporter [Labilithrix luteola]
MTVAVGQQFETDLPTRMDRLPWSRWHWRVVVALGITWMLDGLEVTLVGAIAPTLTAPDTLHLTESQIGNAATAYLAGAIAGALVFGRLTDKFGRKRLFFVTLGVYLSATLATALSWNFASFALCRAVTGAGIGGEYAAVNSAIDELLPARVRGRADLAINSTYWLGTALGSLMTLLLLDSHFVPRSIGWRCVFVLGALIGLSVLALRRHVPESPRWLLLHGRLGAAKEVVTGIEREVSASTHEDLSSACKPRKMEAKGSVTFRSIARVLLRRHLRRTILGLSLMVAQAFAYNGVFFTYALVLTRFYGVSPARIGLYLLPFAAGNLLGPLLLGRLFDTIGRRTMIALTYGVGGVLIAVAGYGLVGGWLTATTQTLVWCIVFFVASAAASSAYLTVSELFPVELRGMAIALFYAVGTAIGGLVAPSLFGALIQTGERSKVFIGYALGAALMVGASIVTIFFGVQAEQKSLEALSGVEADEANRK